MFNLRKILPVHTMKANKTTQILAMDIVTVILWQYFLNKDKIRIQKSYRLT